MDGTDDRREASSPQLSPPTHLVENQNNTAVHPTPTPTPAGSGGNTNRGIRDVFLWRRKNLSFTLLVVSTALWVLLQVYQYNFVTLASWVLISILSLAFLSGNIFRLLGKEPPKLSGLEISEESAAEVANAARGVVEEIIRWMFHVGAEREWFVFAQVVAALLILSYLATLSHFLTLLYTGTVLGMTVPVMYNKYGDKINGCWDNAKLKSASFYEKLIQKCKTKLYIDDKEKKLE